MRGGKKQSDLDPVKPPKTPRPGRKVFVKAALAGLLIVVLTAATVVGTGLLEVEKVKNTFIGKEEQQIVVPEITRAEAGQPRTFLLLGADQRWDDKKLGKRGLSDTILVARVDPDKNTIAVMGVPRDLKVKLSGRTDRINAAYAYGGPRQTVKILKQVFEGATGEPFIINNVFNANFGGFRRAINHIGGVYVDVDHRYFNDNAGVTPGSKRGYAAIDIHPGYQKLRGQKALDYVRFRHTDTDFTRTARQQDFLRQTRSQPNTKELMSVEQIDEIGKLFSNYLQVDSSLRSTKQLISVVKLTAFSGKKPIRQVPFRATALPVTSGPAYVIATPEQIRATWQDFMYPKQDSAPKKQQPKPEKTKHSGKKSKKGKSKWSTVAGIESARREGEDQAIIAAGNAKFPFYFPTLRVKGSVYFNSINNKKPLRVYDIEDNDRKKYRSYRLVAYRRLPGEYYGIQGTTWLNPPILDNPNEERTVRGRNLLLFYDGSKLRLVAWKTKKASYWVSNTLTRSLSNKQMIAIASSLTRLKR